MGIAYLYAKAFKKLHGKCLVNCKIAPTSVIYSGCELYGCTIGRYSYISYNSKLINTQIGSFCSIADSVNVGSNEHPIEWVSTSPVFQNVSNSGSKKRFARFDLSAHKETIIGNDVWIGHGAVIKSGVCVGDGAVVGAGAVVTKDVPPYAVVVGVPAKIIKFRFKSEEVEDLLDIKWWEWPEEKLKAQAFRIKDVDDFIAANKD